MTILAFSDWIDPLIYSESMKKRMADVDLIINCGDVSTGYMDFVMSELNKPLVYVVGNHLPITDYEKVSNNRYKVLIPECFKNAHMKFHIINNVIITGFQGSNWYNGGPFQYKQWEVYLLLLLMVPRLIYNKIKYGRFVDIFVAHSPPNKVGDRDDKCHTGFKAFNLFIKLFKPKLFLHGHIHITNNNEKREYIYDKTRVINVSGFQKINFDL